MPSHILKKKNPYVYSTTHSPACNSKCYTTSTACIGRRSLHVHKSTFYVRTLNVRAGNALSLFGTPRSIKDIHARRASCVSPRRYAAARRAETHASLSVA
jgi:hypothetical protein